jgi:hypothetical protein
VTRPDDGVETDCGSAAAYVLGALPSHERLAFESHLAGCADCRAEVADLAGIPGLLARVTPDDLADDAPSPVPDTLLPRLLREVRRRRRSRWVAAVGVAAAAVAAVLVGVVAAHPGQDAPARVAMTRLVSAPISASVALEPDGHLTRIDMRCRYEGETYGDLPAYRLVVTGVDGRSHEIAWWDVGPDGDTRVVGSVDLPRSAIASVEVRTAAGRPVLRLLG